MDILFIGLLIFCGLLFFIANYYKKQLKINDQKYEKFYNEKLVLEKSAIERKFEFEFLCWKNAHEKKIRADSIKKSENTIKGRVGEHFAPYLTTKYNPKDFRFLGSTPVDFIIFDGLSEGNIREIIFLEVKSGKYAKLTSIETQLKKVVESKQIKWDELKINNEKI
jgi:predicted Holliday junction resolvase-like endonuclease